MGLIDFVIKISVVLGIPVIVAYALGFFGLGTAILLLNSFLNSGVLLFMGVFAVVISLAVIAHSLYNG